MDPSDLAAVLLSTPGPQPSQPWITLCFGPVLGQEQDMAAIADCQQWMSRVIDRDPAQACPGHMKVNAFVYACHRLIDLTSLFHATQGVSDRKLNYSHDHHDDSQSVHYHVQWIIAGSMPWWPDVDRTQHHNMIGSAGRPRFSRQHTVSDCADQFILSRLA